jgi:CheY-like chemotaxis protein
MGYVVAAVWTFRILRALGRWLASPEGKQAMADVAAIVRGLLWRAILRVRAAYGVHFSRSRRVAELVSRMQGPAIDFRRKPESSRVAPASALPIWKSNGSPQIRVFVVDDLKETCDNLAKLIGLESDMRVVGVARDGAEALRSAAAANPDIVLMDIDMPVMDGIMATEVLTGRPGWKAPVVMMSIRGTQDYRSRALVAGARGFLEKPFSADELIGFIREVHNLEHGARALT